MCGGGYINSVYEMVYDTESTSNYDKFNMYYYVKIPCEGPDDYIRCVIKSKNTLNIQDVDFIQWFDYIVNYERAVEILGIPIYDIGFMSERLAENQYMYKLTSREYCE